MPEQLTTAPEGSRTRFREPSGSFTAWAVFAGLLTLLSALVFRGVLADPAARVYASNDDTSLFIWWFAHAADAVASWFGAGSGETSLLLTTQMNHPEGVNGAWNTSMLGLAVPLAPLTWWLGPVVVFNLCIVASPIAAGLACAFFLSRITDRIPAFAGALLYAFSPYLIAQAGGHLNLSFAVLPPLVGAFLWTAVTAAPAGTLRERTLRLLPGGVLLGGAVGWQFYLSSELLAGTFLAAMTCLLVLACVLRGRLLRRLGPAAAASACAVLTAVLLAAPLLAAMAGGQGAPRTEIRPHGVWNNDLLDLVVPPGFTALGGFGGDATGGRGFEIPRVLGIDPAEIGGYVSVAWLLVAVWAVVRTRRSARFGALTRIVSCTGVLVWLLSMGSPLRFAGVEPGLPGPFRLVEHLPVLHNVLPMRLSVHVVLCLSVLAAVLLHTALRAPRGRIRGRLLPIAAICAVAALTAPVAVPSRAVVIPEFFRSGVYAEALPAGSLVKTVPQPRALAEADADQAMVWQAVTGMHYRETGGYFIGSTAEHDVIYQALLDPLDQVLREVEESSLADVTEERIREAAADSARRGTDFLLVPREAPRMPAPGDELAERLARSAGAEAVLVDDVWVLDLRGLG